MADRIECENEVALCWAIMAFDPFQFANQSYHFEYNWD
jgi:hypothetical protein